MSKILTAEIFCKKIIPPIKGNDRNYYKRDSDVYKAMIEFAKLHVQVALKEASEKAETVHDSSFLAEICNMSNNTEFKNIKLNDLIWRPSILNAYPLDLIK